VGLVAHQNIFVHGRSLLLLFKDKVTSSLTEMIQ
jgi:hypothetical protein